MDIRENEQAESTDALIIEAGPDRSRFVRLYRACYDDVFRYCAHRLFERHTAEDVTSEVFLKAVEHWDRFEGRNEQQFRCWLYRIATNAVNDHLRKTGRRQRLLGRLDHPDEYVLTDSNGFEAEEFVALKTVMFALKPMYQTIIALRFFENLKLTQIAEVLGCSPGTARSRLARAMAQLRKRLQAAGVFDRDGGDRDG